MATTTIPQLPVATSATGADLLVISQGNVTKQISTTAYFTNAVLTSPVFVTPTLGVATATSVNKIVLTPAATGATLTIADGKTVTIDNTIRFIGTDSTVITFPSSSSTVARSTGSNTFTGNQTFTNAIIESVQNLSGAGALNLTTNVTTYSSTGTGDALTLADGVLGQLKKIVYVAQTAGADTGILTPTNFGNGTTITLNAVGDACTLQFLGTEWWVISTYGTVVVA